LYFKRKEKKRKMGTNSENGMWSSSLKI